MSITPEKERKMLELLKSYLESDSSADMEGNIKAEVFELAESFASVELGKISEILSAKMTTSMSLKVANVERQQSKVSM